MLKKISLSIVLLGLLSGCVSYSSKNIEYKYNQSEMAPYLLSGKASVSGQAFLRQQGGGVVVCAGEPVMLLPNIGVFKRAFELRKNRVIAKVSNSADGRVTTAAANDPIASKAVRRSTCDAQGNFVFNNLPAGEWIIYSRVQWVVGQYSIQQGSDLLDVVKTGQSDKQRILLTDTNRV